MYKKCKIISKAENLMYPRAINLGAANASEDKFNLILDQGGDQNLTNPEAGISFVQGEEKTTLETGAIFGATFTWGSADSSGISQYQILTDAGYKVQITQTVRISTLLFGYDDTTDSNDDSKNLSNPTY